MLERTLRLVTGARRRLAQRRLERRWQRLRELGMHIGRDVFLPASTWIDESHCFLISIGDDCGFGERCLILAHDAQMNEFLGVTRVGRVVIHPSSHIGAGTIILPGVEIGPRTLVAAGSVVWRSLPANTLCAGAPARVISSLEEYLDGQRRLLEKRPVFSYADYADIRRVSPRQRADMLRSLADGDGYITAGPVSGEAR